MTVVDTTAGVVNSSVLPTLVAVVFAAAFGLLFSLRRASIRGTTLAAPWIWAGISFATLVGVELAIAHLDAAAARAAALRYAGAMSTFCPIVALLGAKRPQDSGWQWIVLSLWCILCQPAGEWILFGGVAEVHPARFWFLMILVLVGATNGLGTRNWFASASFAAGQIVLLLPFFSAETPLPARGALPLGMVALGLGCLLMSAAWTTLVSLRPRAHSGGPMGRAWLDFRDGFGVVWALRIMERVNASARMYDWPVQLAWHGFESRASEKYAEPPSVVEESFRTLLRRFVSPEWIDQRIDSHEFRAATTLAEPVAGD